MRFSPRLKASYDYGLIIFILTFCLVSLSDNTENELLEVAQERLLTIIIGSCIAIVVSICICPVWIGQDLHNQIAGNIQKLADFLEGNVNYFICGAIKPNNSIHSLSYVNIENFCLLYTVKKDIFFFV